jgi:hypothetical protein
MALTTFQTLLGSLKLISVSDCFPFLRNPAIIGHFGLAKIRKRDPSLQLEVAPADFAGAGKSLPLQKHRHVIARLLLLQNSLGHSLRNRPCISGFVVNTAVAGINAILRLPTIDRRASITQPFG